MPCLQPFRDDNDHLLLYKIALCLSEGGFVAGVSSFNGQTGPITFTGGDVITLLGFTPISEADGDARYVLKTGDSMSGALSINNGSLVASEPALTLSQTWNNAAVAFSLLQLNAVNTASSSGSLLIDVQQDSITRFAIFQNGALVRFLRQDQTNSALEFFLRKRGNSVDSTGAIASGAGVSTLFSSGWNGAAQAQVAAIRVFADEAFTGIANGSRLEILSTPIGVVGPVIVATFSGTLGLVVARSITLPYVAKVATYTATALDHTIDCTSGTFDVDLPTAVGIAGRLYVIKNSGVGTITIDPAGAELIDSLATATVPSGASLTVQSTGTGWIII